MNFCNGIIFVLTVLLELLVVCPVAASESGDQNGLLHQAEIHKHGRCEKLFVCDGANGEALLGGEFALDKSSSEHLNRLGLVTAFDEHLGRFILYKGRLLLAARNNMHLLLANADLDIAAHSLVYISDNGAGTCDILNLHDEHSEAVIIHVGAAQFELPPGRRVLLSSNLESGFDELNLCVGVRFRGIRQSNPVPTIRAFFSQYSLPSAMQILPAISHLAKSQTKQGNKMLKTAAAVYVASGYPGDFYATVGSATGGSTAGDSATGAAANAGAVKIDGSTDTNANVGARSRGTANGGTGGY